MKRRIAYSLAALAALLTACSQKPATTPAAPAVKTAAPVRGATVAVTERQIPRFLRVTGQLQADALPVLRRLVQADAQLRLLLR